MFTTKYKGRNGNNQKDQDNAIIIFLFVIIFKIKDAFISQLSKIQHPGSQTKSREASSQFRPILSCRLTE
jgi:hypothetical protein